MPKNEKPDGPRIRGPLNPNMRRIPRRLSLSAFGLPASKPESANLKKPLTVYQQHKEFWKDCTNCELHKTRTKVVIAKGKIPCHVLFVGEAPGKSEDHIGAPFIGPAGDLLAHILHESIDQYGRTEVNENGDDFWEPYLRYAFTNLICCVPVDDEGNKQGAPPKPSIEACSPRLIEFIEICQPRLIICVGSIPRDWFDQDAKKSPFKFSNMNIQHEPDLAHIRHPSAILKGDISQRNVQIQEAIVDVSEACEDLLRKMEDEGLLR